MKSLKITISLILAGTMSIWLTSCADLGFGVDVDSGGAYPYWYGGGGISGIGWDGPWYNAPTPLPIYGPGYGPGPVIDQWPSYRPPMNPRPPMNRPPQTIPSNPTPSRPTVTLGPNGVQRPGNMGRPTSAPTENRGSGGLNLNRGR